MMYQVYLNGKPAYEPDTFEGALHDLKAEYDTCARSSSTEEISEIENNEFTVFAASGKSYTYTIENVMKTIVVNIEKQTVTLNNERCNFYEAGLIPNGIVVADKEEIREHFIEREGEDCEIIFE